VGEGARFGALKNSEKKKKTRNARTYHFKTRDGRRHLKGRGSPGVNTEVITLPIRAERKKRKC